jgi:heme-degrading monooxygenase HmoA
LSGAGAAATIARRAREGRMFVAMNRFRVAKGAEDAFEALWRGRDSRLAETPGFVSFSLLRGPARDDHTLYCSHSVWADRDAFAAWTRSEAFREAHRDVGARRALYLGAPDFEGFEAVEGA